MTDNNQQYKWRQRKQRNTRLGIWIVVVILVSVGGTFAYEGLRDSDPQRVAEEYVKKATGVESFTVEAGDRSLNAWPFNPSDAADGRSRRHLGGSRTLNTKTTIGS